MALENDFQIVPEFSPPPATKKEEAACIATSPNASATDPSLFDAVVVASLHGCKRSQSSEDSAMEAPKSKKPRLGSGPFAVCHINEDEQNLTPADVQKYHHLLPGSSGQ